MERSDNDESDLYGEGDSRDSDRRDSVEDSGLDLRDSVGEEQGESSEAGGHMTISYKR